MNFLFIRLAVWAVTLVLFPVPVKLLPLSFRVEVLQPITADESFAWGGEERRVDVDLAERVGVYLEQAEKRELDPWLRDDYRIAWITVQWSRRGVPDWSWHRDSSPYVAATYQVLRCHPDQVWPRIVARRHAMLGAEYEAFFGGASSPKKPVRSVGRKDFGRQNSAA